MKTPIRIEIEPEYGPDGKLTAECVAKARGEMRAALEGVDLSAADRVVAERAIDGLLSQGTTPTQILQRSRDNILSLIDSCLMRLSDLPDAVMGLAVATSARPHVYEFGKVSAMVQIARATLSTAREVLEEATQCCDPKPESKPVGQA